MENITINSKVRLNSGYEMPLLGYGLYLTPKNIAERVTKRALEVGYRHIDSAYVYQNEHECGEAMRKSDIPREEIFFTTKILTRVMTYESAKAQIQRTFMNSGLGYLDLLLVHAPFGGPEGRKGAWRAVVEAQEAGITRSIGVSNYGVHHLDELEAYIKELEQERGPGRGGVIDVGQWELHPWMPRPDIQEWCKRRGIMLQAYSPVTQGKRLDDPLLKPLVQKHGKTAAQILLRWSLQMGFSPLPKSANPTRIQENSDVYDFELDEEDMKCLDTGVYESCTWDPTLISLSE